MNDYQLLPVGGKLDYEFNFAADVPVGVTVAGIAVTVPPTITKDSQNDDLANKKTTVVLSGGTHGLLYVVSAKATLSNGVHIPKSLTLRVHADR